jgi:hypothetical protein
MCDGMGVGVVGGMVGDDGAGDRLFFNTPTAGRGVQVDLYPTCIQAQRMVGASKSHEISNQITRHSAVNIGQIRSIQVTNCSTIS